MEEDSAHKEYYKYSKYLKKNGYIHIQKSVVIKYIKNCEAFEGEVTRIKHNSPKSGKIYIWQMSYEKYASGISLVDGIFPTEELREEIIEF